MVLVFKRYRIAIAIFIAMILLALTWIVMSRQNIDKIPSRGVFVANSWHSCI